MWRIIKNKVSFGVWEWHWIGCCWSTFLLGCLLLKRTLDGWLKIQNHFTEVSGIIWVCVLVTKIRFWSLTFSCIFHSVKYAIVILVIVHMFNRNFISGRSCKQCVHYIICCSSVFNCWLHRWAFHAFVHVFFWMMHQWWHLYWSL